MARTISATRPVGPAGYGADARSIIEDVQSRTLPVFMGNQRATEALNIGALREIRDHELSKDIAHQGQVAQAILGASRAEGQRALKSEELDYLEAAADDWKPKAARGLGAAAPALAMGALAYEHYNSPEQQALRAAKAARPDSSMPMPGQMNPEDLATLQGMSQPLQAHPGYNVVDDIDTEVDRVNAYLNTVEAAKSAMNRPSGQLDQLYSDAAREQRQQALQFANDPDSQRMRRAANVPRLDSMVTPSQMHPSDLGELMELGRASQVPMEFNPADVNRTANQLEHLQDLKAAGMMPQSFALDELYKDAAREEKFKQLKDPQQRRMRRAAHTPQFDMMPTQGQMNPADVLELQELSRDHGPVEPFDEQRLGETMQFVEQLEALKATGMMPQSFALDELYRERQREKRRQLLESGAIRAMRRNLANMPANPYLEGY